VKGLPEKLEIETYNALRPIFLKYLNMKKSHMPKNRIAGIMYDVFPSICRTSKKNNPTAEK